jgi:hypothetical protein
MNSLRHFTSLRRARERADVIEQLFKESQEALKLSEAEVLRLKYLVDKLRQKCIRLKAARDNA